MSRRPLLVVSAAALTLAAAAASALAWWSQQHVPMTSAAVALLPADAPEFFRRGADALGPYSSDPDVWKEKVTPALRAAEGPNHYIDLELLGGRQLPDNRWRYGGLCREMKTQPNFAGVLPYAIEEWYGRLLLAFAEHRKWPADSRVQAKALYVAGVLAHYAGDAAQPLHTTIHFDGRTRPDGTSPRSGIHARVDALPEKLALSASEIARGQQEVQAFPRGGVFAAAMAAILESHAKVDLVYRLEPKLPGANAEPPAQADPEVRAFALERARAAARLTAGLWYTAWAASADVRLPDWHGVYGGEAPVRGGGD